MMQKIVQKYAIIKFDQVQKKLEKLCNNVLNLLLSRSPRIDKIYLYFCIFESLETKF